VKIFVVQADFLLALRVPYNDVVKRTDPVIESSAEHGVDIVTILSSRGHGGIVDAGMKTHGDGLAHAGDKGVLVLYCDDGNVVK
jgi:hypothetical protein